MVVWGVGMSDETEGAAPPGSLEAAFQSLPPLGSAEYLAYVDQTRSADLRPEVLVRALRQLPPTSPAWQSTIERLFRGQQVDFEIRWDYLQPLVAHARRQARRARRDDY